MATVEKIIQTNVEEEVFKNQAAFNISVYRAFFKCFKLIKHTPVEKNTVKAKRFGIGYLLSTLSHKMQLCTTELSALLTLQHPAGPVKVAVYWTGKWLMCAKHLPLKHAFQRVRKMR